MPDLLLWILAIICFIVAAYGTYKTQPPLAALGWIGLVFAALTFIV